DPNEAHAAALEAWLAAGADTADADLATGAARIGLPPDLLDRPLSALSSGQGVRAALLPLAARPHDAILLDEPTNHLDAGGRALLDDLVGAHQGALVVASHDRTFLAAHADRIVELDPRGGAPQVFAGGWDAYEREQAAARRGAQEAFDQATARRDELVAAERETRRRAAATRGRIHGAPRDGDKHVKEWFSMRADGVEARGATVGARAARIEIPDKPWKERPLTLELTAAEQRSRYVVALEGATVQRGAWTSPVFDVEIAAGERILLRGANGSGKSTLLGALGGTLPLASGIRDCGPQAVVSVLGAVEEALASEQVLVDAVRALTGLDPAPARGRLAQVGLLAELADRPASTLSPGERTRAELAVLGARRTTCLLLDEPSNHLDLRALEALEAALDGWPGALVVATHDEAFAERLRPTRELVL
ncbi:MAG: ATP-binding cassette domain-containing protein, partial [Solirubrobacteraceae bacterium]